MGFWTGVGRMIKGEPVFTDSNAQPGGQPAGNMDGVSSNEKTIPSIVIESCKSRLDGNRMETTIWIKNTSHVEVELDRIELLDETMALDRRLQPNESREVWVYKGDMPKDDAQDKAHLYFTQVRNDDLFCAEYSIEFNHESNGLFSLEDFHPIHPIRDI